MADWNTHLYCAQKVNLVLKYTGAELDMFLFGNLLPDVNPGWNITPVVHIDQAVTHCEEDWTGQDYFWSTTRFYEKYVEEIKAKNPLYLGYLFHLWLDVSVMTYFVSKVPMSELVLIGHGVRKWKWQDMGIFIKNHPGVLTIDNVKKIEMASKGIEEIDICAEDLIKIPDYLRQLASEETNNEYHVLNEKGLKEFYDRVCGDFAEFVMKL